MALTTILEEQTLTFAEDSGLWISTLNMYVPLTVGGTYKVTWDGTEYEMTAVEVADSGLTLPVIGNTSLLGIDDAVDTGEPFCIYHIPSEYAGTETGLLFIFASDTSTTHTVAIYQGTEESGGEEDGDGGTGEDNDTEEEPEGIVLKDRNGNDVAYYGIETVTFDTTTEGKQQKYTKGVKAEKTVELSLADGDQTVEPDEGTLLSRVTIAKPETLVPENIRKGVELGGVTGELIGDTEEVSVALDFSNGDMEVTPSEDKLISKVTIPVPETLVPENIAKDVTVAGVIGTMEAGGGGSLGTGEYLVRVVDYDGTILKQAKLNTGEVFALPDEPTHDRLVFDGWSSPVPISNNTVVVDKSDISIGAMYYTASGATEIDIELTSATGLSVNIYYMPTGCTSVDWGDGVTNTGNTHTYSSVGEYTIKLYGCTAFRDCTTSNSVVALTGGTNYYVRGVYLSAGITSIGNYAFRNLRGLKYFTMHSGLNAIGTYAFYSCYALHTVTIPTSVTTIGDYCCYGLYACTCLVLPYGLTQIGVYGICSCYALASLTLPDTLTQIGKNAMTSMYGLRKITIPGGVSNFNESFRYVYNIEIYDFSKYTSVPTITAGDYGAFSGGSAITKMLIPSALYSTWKAATYWSNHADKMVAV